MVPLQTALPLIGLCACGYATDPATARGFDWLLDQRLGDGSWPTGLAGGGDTPGLLLGTAGIGWFYLRLADPEETPSVLLPTGRLVTRVA